MRKLVLVIALTIGVGANHFLLAQDTVNSLNELTEKEKVDSLNVLLDKGIPGLMKAGDIPGLSLVIIQRGKPLIRNYGFADLKKQTPVTDKTLFELGSCSKAFTALAVASLIHDGKLRMDDYVSDYLPWFRVTYEKVPVKITIEQLLHHTSGIPWSTISKIPQSNRKDALEETVRSLEGQKLDRLPGRKYEYATINYDILALIVQKVTKRPFEAWLQENVIDRLQLTHTTIGYPLDSTLMATGYKVGFFRPREYDAPRFRGNNAAGYVTSNAQDISDWLRFQMGLIDTTYYYLARFTHLRDESVGLHDMSSYAMGWEVSLSGNGEIYHPGLNPNFTSYIAFRTRDSIGVAVLANSNSPYTPFIAEKVLKSLAGQEVGKEYDPGDNNDKTFSGVSIVLTLYILVVLIYVGLNVVEVLKGKKKYVRPGPRKWWQLVTFPVGFIPFVVGIYTLPEALFDFDWKAMVVWTPVSFEVSLVLAVASFCVTYVAHIVRLCFPEKNRIRALAPKILLLSMLSGLSNMFLIILITSALESTVLMKYLVFYYVLTLCLYLFGKRFVQVSLTTFTMDVIYEMRIDLMDRIFSTSYQKFEKMDRGLVYTVMNDDVSTIGESANLFVSLVTSVFTTIGALLYLASIAFWATAVTFFLIMALTTIYFFVGRSTNRFFEQSRDTRNVFMRLINGLLDGFKEISLQRNKKKEYKEDVADSANEYRVKMTFANIRFINASFLGEAILVGILGMVAFAFPSLFPGIKMYTLMSFIFVLLYLLGPVNIILTSVPNIMRLRIALNRIKQFRKGIHLEMERSESVVSSRRKAIYSIKAEGVKFQYNNGGDDQEHFAVGPIDLEVHRGEILFIIGGNGSGKTTLAKLLTGLYEPDAGGFRINDEPVHPGELGENISAIFSPVFLFGKLYNIELEGKSEEVERYLKLLRLDGKVEIRERVYSTIDLSGGQRKRLALLQCYLEDAPIYLFDEWAADQDPEYRKFFYRTLLPEMRAKGKIVIAITHDDHYFDIADKVIKMDQGRLEIIQTGFTHANSVQHYG